MDVGQEVGIRGGDPLQDGRQVPTRRLVADAEREPQPLPPVQRRQGLVSVPEQVSRGFEEGAAPVRHADKARRALQQSPGRGPAPSRFTLRLTADCVVPSASAARVKLRSSATRTKASRASRSSAGAA